MRSDPYRPRAAAPLLILEAGHRADFRRRSPGPTQRTQACRPIPFGQAFPRRVGQQQMVCVGGDIQAQDRLHQPMNVGGMEQIDTARDQRDALQVVVQGDA